ncbi:MAG: AAA family ATPase [Bacteroidaceae bacterium]|nr:AAA family ATPase [Bacteroidaceae bacterium]
MRVGYNVLGNGVHANVTPKEIKQFGPYAADGLFAIASLGILIGCGCVIIHKTKKEIESQYKSDNHQHSINQPQSMDGVVLDGKWENFNDAIYNHAGDVFLWLLGNVFLSGSINLLIGPKSIGKTMFVIQMLDCISKGVPFELFVSNPNVPFHQEPQGVYLFDFEMQYNQLKERYGKNGYQFKNIHRNTNQRYTVETFLNKCRDLVATLVGSATIVVDNVTRFLSDITQPVVGKRLYDGIKDIRDSARAKGIEVTFILIAHTSNDWSEYMPITLKSASVADSLTTGMDCICAVGPTRNPSQKLFKIIEARNISKPDKVLLLEHRNEPFCSYDVKVMVKESEILPTRKPSRVEDNTDMEENIRKKTDVKMFGEYTLDQAKKVYEMRHKPTDSKKPRSYRYIQDNVGFKISQTRVGTLLKEYEEYKSGISSDQGKDDDYDEDYE